MPTEQMSFNERRTYLQIMLPRYTAANRFVQSQLLDEMHAVTGLHRKSLIRLLNAEALERQPRERQRGKTYDHTVDDALRVMAETLDYRCAERLQPALPWLAQTLAQHGELELTPPLLEKLQRISVSTARQILQIWRLNLQSPQTPPEQLTFHTRGMSFAPAWSLDGTKILYTSTKDGREQEIFLFDFNDPSRWTRLSFSQDQYLWNQYPSWSPEGKQIVFSSDRGHIAAYTEIWTMNADGSGARKLGDGSRDAWAPVWIKWTK